MGNVRKALCALLLAALPLLAAPAQALELAAEEGYLTTPDGVKLYYQKVGSGERVVILPGRLFVFDDFRRLGERHTVISYDMRNRGRSDFVVDGSKITIEADVADLEAVRRHFGVEKFTPVGYSYLGLMVVLYALEHPERVEHIVQMGAVPLKYGTAYQEQFTAGDAESVRDPAAEERLKKLRDEDRHITHPQEYCEAEWEQSRRFVVGNPANVERVPDSKTICAMPNEWPVHLWRHLYWHFVESVQKLDLPRERVAQVTAPVLTIHGTRDRNAPYGGGREWIYLLPNARLLTIEGAAHQAFAERPEIVFPAIEEFLEGRWPPASTDVTTDPRRQ